MTKPMYIDPANYRDYESFISGVDYAKGWNAAMDFIFPEEAKKREKKAKLQNIKVLGDCNGKEENS